MKTRYFKSVVLSLAAVVFSLAVLADAPAQNDAVRVSIDAKDVDVRDVIRGLAQQANVSVAIAEGVEGRITVSLQDVPWPDAFDAVLQAAGLFGRAQNGLIIVIPRSEAPELLRSTAQEVVPVTRIYGFRFAEAKAVQDAFKALASPSGCVAIDELTNCLVVADAADRIDRMTALAAQIDASPAKVMIEVLIADTVLIDELDIGFNWEAVKINNRSELRFGQNLIDEAGNGGTVSYEVLEGRWTADTFMRAIEQLRDGRILATPKILVLSGQEASIETVEEIPYQQLTETSAGGQIGTTAFKEAGVKLNVLPKVGDDASIFLTLTAEQSAPTGEEIAAVPVINTRKATTTLILKDGQTLVIGGLRRKESRELISQVPLLGDIPLLGALFRYTSTLEENRELIVFLTPRIVTDPAMSENELKTLNNSLELKGLALTELEEKIHDMQADVAQDHIDGIRRRLDVLCSELCRAD